MLGRYILLLCFLFIANHLTIAQSSKDSLLLFSHKHGFYSEQFTLTISSNLPGAKIKYTLNGADPLKSSKAVISNSPAAILINPSNTTNRDKAPGFIITACAILNDTLASKVVTQTYLFLNKIVELSPNNTVPGSEWLVPGTHQQQISYGLDPTVYNNSEYKPQIDAAFRAIPTLSLVTDLRNLFDPDSGIYVNAFYHGEEWERAASLELLNPDTSKGFQINCGIRIRGGWSRHFDNPKRAFRIFFREDYGKGTLKYPLFGDEGANEFDKFDIQTSMNYSWSFYGDEQNTFLRELFSRDAQRDMNQPYTRGKFYHLYINGTYWGLYQIQERSEASFGASYFGGSQEDYDVIKVNVGVNFDQYHVEATDGTLAKWQELWQAAQSGFGSDETYFKVQGLNPDGSPNPSFEKLLDVDNLIDYMIITFFSGDFDSPVSAWRGNNSPNNFYAIYNRVNPDGFKFFRHDAEHSLFRYSINDWGIDRTGPFPAGNNFEDSNPQWIHQQLCENAHYKLRFSDRVYKYFFNNGVLTEQKNKDRINSRKQEIETAIIAESARWGDSKSSTRTKVDWTNAVNSILNDFFPWRNPVVLQQLASKGLYSSINPPFFNKAGGLVEKGFNATLTSGSGKIYYTTDGNDPCSPFSDSFSKTVVEPSASKKVIVPTEAIAAAWKSDLSFDESKWLTTSGLPGGIGYETGSGYENLISLSLQNYMYQGNANPNSTCYIRIPFELTTEDLAKTEQLNFQIMFDDGFIAYLNGVKVAESNAPASPLWNSTSTTVAEAEGYVNFDISSYIKDLKAGTNLLAIHGLNTNTQSSDFLILPRLTIGKSSQGGSVTSSANEYKDPVVINKTTSIKARTLSGTNWSPLSEAQFIIDEDLSSLRITELHYHPLGQDTIGASEYEFVELKNCGITTLELNQSGFVDGIDYKFGEKQLAPGEFIVLAENKTEFEKRYGFSPYDVYSGQLDNGGEKIKFADAGGDSIINFIYDDKLPWAEEADGVGYSLVSKSVNGVGDPSSPDYWAKSASIHGSPGQDDIVSDVNENKIVKIDFRLEQNYPNPFNPSTTINYSIKNNSHVKLIVFDILGKEVARLVDTEMNAGEYSIDFNADDFFSLSSGIYFYSLKAGEFLSTRKMLLLK